MSCDEPGQKEGGGWNRGRVSPPIEMALEMCVYLVWASQCWQMLAKFTASIRWNAISGTRRTMVDVDRDQKRTETKWATKRERKRNENKTKASELQREWELQSGWGRGCRADEQTPRTALIKHKFNLCAILASRINFRRRENNKKAETETKQSKAKNK